MIFVTALVIILHLQPSGFGCIKFCTYCNHFQIAFIVVSDKMEIRSLRQLQDINAQLFQSISIKKQYEMWNLGQVIWFDKNS